MSTNQNKKTAKNLVNLFYQIQDPLPSKNQKNYVEMPLKRQKQVNHIYKALKGKQIPKHTTKADQDAFIKEILKDIAEEFAVSAANLPFLREFVFLGGKRKTRRRNANQKRKTRKV
jgi:hypothetical protein